MPNDLLRKENEKMLKTYNATAILWGGDKTVTETVIADNPKKAMQKARDAVHKRTSVPYGMIAIDKVEIVK